MSRWKKISLAVLVVILLLMGAVGFLVGTTPGLHLLFSAANRWVPGLNIAQVEGGWRSLTLKNLRYEQPGVAVKAGELHLAVGLDCLWHSRLCVNDFSLKDIDVAIDSKKMPPSTTTEKSDSGSLNLSTPYPITLSRVALNHLNLKIDDTAVSVMDFSSGLRWEGSNLTLTPTRLEGVLVALPKTPEVVHKETSAPPVRAPLQEDPSLGETLKKLFEKPLLPEMADFRLPLNLDIQAFRGAHLRLTGDTDLTVNSLLLKASGIDGNLKLDTLDVDSSQGALTASGSAQLSDTWPVNLTLNSTLNLDPLKGEKVKMTVGGALRDALTLGINLSGPLGAQLNAQARLAEAGLPLNVELDSKQLYWPLIGTRQYQADALRLRLAGKVTGYTLSFATSVKGEQVPPATITLDGKGNEQQFSLDKLRVAALQGHTDLNALVDWSKAISWRGELTLDGINTAKQFPDWPAKLAGSLKTRGSLYGGSWQLDIPELKLAGNVKDNKVDVHGVLQGNNYMQWTVPGLHLALGRNVVDVKGELGEKKLNLDTTINAPNLDNVLPGLGGSAKGVINVRGDIRSPQLLADLTASGLRWQALTVARVLLKGDVKSTDRIAGNLNLRVERVEQPGVKVDLVTLDAKGDEKQHQLQLRIQGEPVAGRLNLSGSFDRSEERWRGRLTDTRFETPVGSWSLSRDLTLDFRNKEQRIAIGPHCWVNPNAELCVPQSIDAGAKGRAVVNLNRFDLAMLKPVMPEDTQVSGVFTGKADVSWDSTTGGLPQGAVTLSGRGVKVAQTVNGNTLPVAFDTLNLDAQLKNNRAQLGWMVKIADNGQFDGQVQITDPQGRRNLGGNVNIRNFSLGIVNAIFSRGEKAAGTLNANLRLGGNLERPQMFGQMQLNGIDAEGNFMPFDMQPSQIAMNFNGMNSTLQGVVRTKQGQIVLSGDADWAQVDNWRARIAAKGSKVRITVPPMVRLDVSPDIEFVATPNLFTLNGNVEVPWARIVVHDVPDSAVGISSDEVMLDKDLKPVNPKSAGIPVNSNLTIHVGNNVRLNAFGLKARLTGDLKMVQDKQGLGLNGQISIPQGRFHAYGQDLIVHKGDLLFSGPPDNPYLNIEAIRNPESTENDVTAGVRVTGPADEPKAEIFSDPAMSQQEALSYLLRGQGLDTSGSDGDAMTSMLVGLGVAQSGQIMGKIGETFGVSNLALDTTGAGDSSQVVVSGYVLPGLQVKYGVGIFDSLATLTLRYRLMPKLYLEAVSGVDQALDLLYQFEF